MFKEGGLLLQPPIEEDCEGTSDSDDDEFVAEQRPEKTIVRIVL
jgi:hypothetical protein